MTKLTNVLCAVAAIAIASGAGCKKDEKSGDKGTKGTSAGKTTTTPTEPTTPTTPEPPKWTSEDSMKAFKTCWDAFNAGDAEKLGACYADDGSMIMVDFMGPPMKPVGPAAVTAAIKQYKTGFPDANSKPQLVLASGNKVAAIGIESGTNSGPMMGQPATNKKVSVLFAQILHFDDKGKIKRDWHLADQSTWAHQLGVHSAPKGAPQNPASETAWETTPMIAAPPAKIGEGMSEGTLVQGLVTAMDKKDMATIKAHIADDITFRYVPHVDVVNGAEAYLKGMETWQGMYESLDRKVTDMWGAGDWVVVVSTSKRKIAVDIPNPKKVATKGKETMTTNIEFFQIADKKVKQHWVFENSYAWAVQAGLADAPKMPDPASLKTDPKK